MICVAKFSNIFQLSQHTESIYFT